MKTAIRILFLILVSALLTAFCIVSASAVSAKPGADGSISQHGACRSHSGPIVTLDSVPSKQGRPGAQKAVSAEPVTKNIPAVTIVIGFTNINYDDNLDWGSILFYGDYSLSAYYTDMSFGQFTFMPASETSAFGNGGNTNTADKENDGIVHVNVNMPHSDWTLEKEGDEFELLMMKAFAEALGLADNYVDFASFDANGDGKITTNELAVSFIVAGYEAATPENDHISAEKRLWSHAFSFLDAIEAYAWDITAPKPDGVEVSSYIAVSEFLNVNVHEPICVLAHEMGHYLGLHDYYDTTYSYGEWSDYSVDTLSLMDSAWGTDSNGENIPHSLDPFSRYILGWFKPQTASSKGEYTLRAQNYSAGKEGYSALMIPTGNKGEYYLPENRQNTKWDDGLPEDIMSPIDGGIILWHIDENVYDNYRENNLVNASFHRPAVMPLFPEIDGNKYTFTGTFNTVMTNSPFYTKSYWESEYSSDLGSAAQLPVYGQGLKADSLGAKKPSGIYVTFLSDNAPEMKVGVDFKGNVCPQCGKDHGNSLGGRIIAFFHRIIYAFRSIF